ncbi:hypothetical protein BH11PSE8_BH11PSE8_45810 [soil metagenome]
MSADRDRGTRREKQKRAKEMKRQVKQNYKPADATQAAAAKPADKPAA